MSNGFRAGFLALLAACEIFGESKVCIDPSDAAVLASPEARRDLSCVVTPVRPRLGFDLRFHAGYRLQIPWRELAAAGDRLRAILRVTADDRPERLDYFFDHYAVPPIAAGARGEAALTGSFTVGEGHYRVDWLLRDRRERVCSAHWEFAVKTPAVGLPPHTVRAELPDLFAAEPPIERTAEERGVRVLLHFAPQSLAERSALVEMLRGMARERGVGRWSLVVFSTAERRVLFRQESAASIDFPGLGRALEGHGAALVDYRVLQHQGKDDLFQQPLIENALGSPEQAVVFIGGKLTGMRWEPAPGCITALLKNQGRRVYHIARPEDFAAAWNDILGRLTPRGAR